MILEKRFLLKFLLAHIDPIALKPPPLKIKKPSLNQRPKRFSRDGQFHPCYHSYSCTAHAEHLSPHLTMRLSVTGEPVQT